MARKPQKPRKPTKEAVKAAAARAEARSDGKEIVEQAAPITPPIISAAEIRETAKKVARKKGRPTAYTPAVGRAVCRMLAMGLTVKEIARRPLMPASTTILRWAHNPSHPFSDQYVRAREIGYHQMFDDMVEIADNSRNDWMRRELAAGISGSVLNDEHLQRTKLRLETRWKILARALPKIYGDKVALEHAGKDGGPIQTETSERPQATGSDHLEDISKRYAGKVPPAAPSSKGSVH